jgi:hypothetical protein
MTTDDRRQAKRRRVLKGARILVPEMGISCDCAIRDLSEIGAGLIFTTPVAIGETFELAMYDNTIKQCRVVWRAGRRAGVAFS